MVNNDDKQGFSDRLNAVLDAASITKNGSERQKLLARLFKLTPNAARKWLTGGSIPRYEIILGIVDKYKYLGITVEWLLGGNPELSPFKNDLKESQNRYNIKKMETRAWKVPLINWVQAGFFTEHGDNYATDDYESWPGTSTQPKERTFALRVRGDSMEPLFTEGMLIIVEPDMEPLPDDYVVVQNGNEATFKKLIRDGKDYYLKPLNNRYPIKLLGESHIVGVVREAVLKFR